MAFPATEELVRRAEAALGRSLPAKLRQRLLRDNGGEVEAGGESWQLFPVFDDTDKRRLARTACHLVRENAVARQATGFPAGAVAIAEDGCGNYLVLCDHGDDVERWDHETTETETIEVELD